MKKILYPLIVILLCLPAVWPLFHAGYFPMHDDEQVARLYEMDKAVKDGQIPPRWVSDLGFGYGYPLFNFYPPLVYYLGELIHLTGIGFIDSTKIVMGLGFVFAALAMYKWARSIFGKEAGIIAAVLYTYAPYHSVDLYVRGALAEFFCFIFFPLILIAAKNLLDNVNFTSTSFFALSLSALVLTHSLMVLPFVIFLALYMAFLLFINRKHYTIGSYFLFLISGILTFGLTAYFSLPSILEKNLTLVDEILTHELADYKLHFVYLRQFWDSPWGYGGSVFGLMDGMSFQIGKVHLVLAVLSLISALVIILREMIKNRKGSQKVDYNILVKTPDLDLRHETNPLLRGELLLLFFLLFLLSVFLASFHSQFIWNFLTPLHYLQFPWRFLSITAVFSSIIGGGAFYLLFEKMVAKSLRLFAVVLLAGIIIIVNFSYFRPARYLDVTDAQMTSREDISWRVSGYSFEFVPKGVKTVLSDIGTTQLDLRHEEIPHKGYAVLAGNLEVTEAVNKSQKKSYSVNAKTQGILQINTYNFPGWEASVDGKSEIINDQNKLKLITIRVPEGTHVVDLRFTDTPVRQFGNLLSLISLVVIIVLLILGTVH